MLDVIQGETQHPHHQHYGMFMLVIMTHGTETHLSGSDGELVERAEINSILSAHRFAAMAGKAKVVILQACSGGELTGRWFVLESVVSCVVGYCYYYITLCITPSKRTLM